MQSKDQIEKSFAPFYLKEIITPLGPMIAGTTAEGLCLLEFGTRVNLKKELEDLLVLLHAEVAPGGNLYSTQIENELNEYFAGKRTEFTVPLCTPGNDFARSVWQMLLNIPYGTTWTYKHQSERMQQPLAIRAMAAANGRNRIAIVIPCHRVIGSNGSLTGYAGGIEKKRWLINFEREHAGVQPGYLF